LLGFGLVRELLFKKDSFLDLYEPTLAFPSLSASSYPTAPFFDISALFVKMVCYN